MLHTVVTKIKLSHYIIILRLVYLHNKINIINIKMKYLLNLEYMSPASHEKCLSNPFEMQIMQIIQDQEL